MKKNCFLVVALSVCALVACNKNEENEVLKEPAKTIEMTVVAGDSGTKTSLNGSSIIWSGTEQLKLIEAVTGGDDNGKFYSKDSSSGVSEDEGLTMSFNVTLDAHTGATSFKYAALYPNTSWEATTSFSNIAVNTLDSQNPSASSFDPAADMLISQASAESATQPTSINMAFARKVALGQMTIKNLGSSEDITSITFSAQKKDGGDYKNVLLAGRSKVNFTTSEVDYGSNIKRYSIVLDYEGDGVKVNSAEGAPAYFVCYPFSLAAEDKFTVVVETETMIFTRTITLSGVQALAFTAGDVSRFSVNMSGIAGVTKAVSLHYAEFTKADANAAGVTSATYTPFDATKTHGDRWGGTLNNNNGGFGLRNSASTNDSYLKLPDFVEEISTITVELSQPIAAPYGSNPTPYLSLETASNVNTKTIASLDRDGDAKTYVFNVAENHINTAYLRATNNPAYVLKVTVITAKTDSREKLDSPTSVSASLSGTNDISVSWTKASNAVGYEIVCAPTVGETVVTQVGDIASYKVENLANNTEYTVSVASLPDPYTHKKSDAQDAASTVETSAPAVASFHYEKVTATPSPNWNGTYLLVCEDGQVFTGAISTTSTKYGLYAAVSISESEIAGSDTLEGYEVTLAYNSSYTNAGYTIQAKSKYLFWSSGNSLNSGNTVSGQNNIWDITLSSGIIKIQNQNTTGNDSRWIKFSTDRFACYAQKDGDYSKTNGKAVHLYKRVED